MQRINVRLQRHAFIQVNNAALAAALAPELMHLSELPGPHYRQYSRRVVRSSGKRG
ncbi:phage polarity suppression protein [Cedecea sp. NFIX57]|uniref:phage polarity suppression protein n=1 Tax=Cedecea sp. NFIX57 TaxID=1566286 RepID=UPI0020CB6786|nr:phage polarity suppression protein [Cedecea sp. NFIX57]